MFRLQWLSTGTFVAFGDMISPNSIHGGGISTPRCGASSRLTWALDAVLVLEDLLIVTDLLMVLDATLFAAFALFAALFFSPAALLVAARVRGSAHPGLSPVVLPLLLPGFPSDGNSHYCGCCHDCFQSPGMMLAAMRRDFLLWTYLLAAMNFAVFEGWVFETLSEVVFELVLPCLAGTFALAGQVSSFHTVSDSGAETELPDHVCVNAENDALDGAFVVGSSAELPDHVCVNADVDALDGAFDVGSSGSCIEPVCSSSTGFGRKEEKGKAEDVKWVQFFVNRGKGSVTVVRCSSDTVLSEVLHLDDDEYALCGSRFGKVGCTTGEIFIGNCSNVQVLRRLRGGVLVSIWIFRGSGSAKFVVLLGVGQPGNDALGVMLPVTWFPTTSPWVLWDGRPHSLAVLVLPLVALVLVIFLHGIPVLEVCSLCVLVLVLALVVLRLRKRLKQVTCCKL